VAPIEVCYPVRKPDLDDPKVIRRAVREELGVPFDSTVILQASRLERWKGQDVLIRALSELRDIPDWHAWIAGGPQKEGEEEFLNELKLLAKQAGTTDRIRFLGQRSDVQQVMRAADIYCQPNSGPEPFGIAFIEALYASLPVVTFDFGGAAEIVTPSCGMLCDPGNVQAVSSVLRELVKDPALRLKLGEAGPSRAAELCDPTRQLAILAEVIANTPTGVA
jgi:glycosyltransferase involved in cell wall biosynthesis